ncbi:hypothetical protein EJ06DRAFT_498892 [Trichodelitschia bisporula]|uniref:DNA-directed RNA polymerase III subunit RPC3 n=1 Tax=Trichodelitschia bisporula TaxID=703511 RepID=A0A6G1HMC7_9PEZI|nr:hypothetical protein EJ06DRAFT_498892 [Trichodelitschia bisporula]
MKKRLSELLTFAVGDFYGEFHSRVFGALVENGRLPFRTLVAKSGLLPTQVRGALITLIQQSFVSFQTTDEGATNYDANWEKTYNFVIRSGKLLQLVKVRYGDAAGVVCEDLFEAGHARVGELIKERVSVKEKPASTKGGAVNGDGVNGVNGINGVHVNGVTEPEGHGPSPEQRRRALNKLVRAGLIVPLNERDMKSVEDLKRSAERNLIGTKYDHLPKTKKEKTNFALDTQQLLDGWRHESLRYFGDGEYSSIKRGNPFDEDSDDEYPAKRRKVHGRTNGVNAATGPHPETDLVVRLNFEKFDVLLRNQQLVKMAARYVGETTSKVYDALLRALETKTSRCYEPSLDHEAEDKEQPFVKTHDIVPYLDPNLDLNVGLYGEDVASEMNGHNDDDEEPVSRKRKQPSSDAQYKVEQHLRLLAYDPRQFVQSEGRDWRVPYRALTKRLLQSQIENHLTARYGTVAPRLIRVLFANGRLEDKNISKLALVPLKELREMLYVLQKAGFVESQEVPRDASRTVNRLVYLYFYDQIKARRVLLDDVYQAMARMLQRAETEKAKIQVVIDKSERTDVVGNEAKYLSKAEKVALERWNQTEEKLLRQVNRMDDLVAVVRDFYPMGPDDSNEELYG